MTKLLLHALSATSIRPSADRMSRNATGRARTTTSAPTKADGSTTAPLKAAGKPTPTRSTTTSAGGIPPAGDGSCYHAIAELAWLANPDFVIQPSVIDKPGEGGPDLTDYLLVTDAMRPHVIDSSYHVHIPDGPPFPSDHHLVTTTIDV